MYTLRSLATCDGTDVFFLPIASALVATLLSSLLTLVDGLLSGLVSAVLVRIVGVIDIVIKLGVGATLHI